MPTRNRTSIAATLCTVFTVTMLLALAPTALADTATPRGGAVFSQQTLSAPKGAFVGRSTTLNGHVESGGGRYAISAKIGKADWLPVTQVIADGEGDFTFSWKARKQGRYNFRITPVGNASASQVEATGLVHVYRKQKTTWYGPGFYGKRTACGKKLTKRTIGVAHRKLKCGTKVEFFHAGKKIVVPVIDRGPFVRGVRWDLTFAAMKRLGSSETIMPGVLPLR
ncbi:MAG: septal ring lytic transglycosylase RlpA family protein [Solirubrobacterales bacterium]